jgi:PEP-CTERM motif
MKKMIFALAAALPMLGGTAARAQPTLDFTVPASNPGASISYAGGATDLVGTGITITQVQGLDTPMSNLVIEAITSGALNFTSGAFTGNVGTSEWVFGAGPAGGLTITGGISSLGLANGSTLLSGTIESVSVIAAGSTFKVGIAAFLNTINSTLASHYGFQGGSGASWTGVYNIGFNAKGSAPGSFSSSSVQSGGVDTSPIVPEPSSLVIAGLGALGMIAFGLWRRKAVGP